MSASASTLVHSPEDVTADRRTLLGFWIYLMTDCVLFAGLFACYAVLHISTFGGPSSQTLFSLPTALAETLALLLSSFTCGVATLGLGSGRRRQVEAWFAVTFALGAVFIGIELSEFHRLVADGDSWTRSGFLSAYFVLVGVHGLHVVAGLTWMTVLVWRVHREGLTRGHIRRLTLLSVFWHFLDLIWICIFSIVYLMGVIHG